MKIAELKEGEKVPVIELKIIYDKIPPKKLDKTKGKHEIVRTFIVADIDGEKGTATAMLDVYDKDINKFKFLDQLLVNDAWCKRMNNGQIIITNPATVEKIGEQKQ